MSNYEKLSDEALVAEVARRMPQNKYRSHRGQAQKFHSIVWEAWHPDTDPLALEDVKREIERRTGWFWRAHYNPHIGSRLVYIYPDVGVHGWAESENEPRAWLLAFLRADDAGKEASGE